MEGPRGYSDEFIGGVQAAVSVLPASTNRPADNPRPDVAAEPVGAEKGIRDQGIRTFLLAGEAREAK